MANKLLIKRSSVASKVPTTGDLELGELAINTYDGKLYLKKDNGSASIVEIGAGGGSSFPSGTLMLFQQTAAPTGWTKQTTHNDKALRVVSGTASSGGSTAFTSVFASRTPAGTISNTTAAGTISNTTAGGTVGSTTLTVSQIPAHAHKIVEAGANSNAVYNTYSLTAANTIATSPATNNSRNDGTSNTGGGTSHNHSFTGTSHGHTFTGTSHGHTFTGTAMDFAVQYVDLIIASKD